MKIVMLGYSGVGKTTYMAAMYGALQRPVNGFSLRAQASQHQELIGAHRALVGGRYPPPTTKRDQYAFDLLHNGRAVFPFQWVDYRGRALTERSQSEEASRLVADLAAADGIMLFCDSRAFETGQDAGDVEDEIGRMMVLASSALERGDERPVPITIVFTKSDLVGSLDQDLLTPVYELFTTVSQSKFVAATYVPVACGRQTSNVELPVLFTLFVGIWLQVLVLSAESELLKRSIAAAVADGQGFGGLLKNVWRSINSEPTSYERAQYAQKLLEERLAKLSVLGPPSKRLQEYIHELPVVTGTAFSTNE